MKASGESFTLDKKIPITVVLAIMFQVAVGIGFGAVFVERVGNLESSVSGLQKKANHTEGLNIKQEIMQEQLVRIEDKLDRLFERNLDR
jgi:hypothetical protein